MTVSNEITSTTPGATSGSTSPPGSGKAAVAKDAASDVASTAVENARSVAADAGTQVKAVATQAKEHVQSLATQTRSELLSQADTKGQQAASSLRTLSQQLTALTDGRPGDAGPLPHYLHEAREKVSTLAERIEQGGPQGVLDDLTTFARRRPGMFLLGAVGAGFVVGRMVRAGAAAASEHSHDQPRRADSGTTQSPLSVSPAALPDAGATVPTVPTAVRDDIVAPAPLGDLP